MSPPQLIKNILELHDAPVWIEQVSARPGQGVTSMFNFGKSYGMVLGVAAGLGYVTNYVTPQNMAESNPNTIRQGRQSSQSNGIDASLQPAIRQKER